MSDFGNRDLVPPSGAAPRIAAIDLGTNSVRLIVAEIGGPVSYRVLREEREQTRLGYRLDETGRIDRDRLHVTLEAIGRMQAVARGFGIEQFRAVGTAALREAENGLALVAAVHERFGLELEVISAEEEAELALRSVLAHFPPFPAGAAIVDIGGGSMEVAFTTAGTVERVHSMPLGAVRLTERHVHSDPVSAADWRALRAAIDRELIAHIGTPPFPTPELVGSGGTFTAVASLTMHDQRGEIQPIQGYSMTPAEFTAQFDRLRETPLAARRRFPGLDADRADIVVAGAAAVVGLVEKLDVDRILISERGVRDGLLLEMISRPAR